MENLSKTFKLNREDKEEIKKVYMEACTNRIFKELIKTIETEADDTLLMKYTSTLMDAAIEFENCKNCSSIKDCKNAVKGSFLRPSKEDKRIIFSYVNCHYADNEKYKKNVQLFDVSNAVRNANVKEIYTNDRNRVAVIKYIKDFVLDYNKDRSMKGLYLHGSFGSGKTYLVAALFNELARKGTTSIIVHVPELLRSIKESFDSDYSERFAALKKINLLLLDDIGAEYLTAWGRDEVIEPLLQYRMDEGLPTFFTSNFTLDELEKHFATSSAGEEKVKAKRIIERIKQLSITIELITKNMRK